MKNAVRLTVFLWLSSLAAGASAQSNNLLKNANLDDGTQFWRFFGNTTVTDCLGTQKCFSLTQEAFVYQDVEVTENIAGTYAVLIAFTSIEEPNVEARRLGHPYLFGDFLNSSEQRDAGINSKLKGRIVATRPKASGEWVRQYGVLRVAEGTRYVRIKLSSGCPYTTSSATCTSFFRRPGIFLFGSEEEANAFVSAYQ
jgi:hypothetical protein